MNNSEDLPTLPEKWCWAKLGNISKSINPGFPSGKHNTENVGIPHLRPMNVSSKGKVDLSILKYVEVSDYKKLLVEDVLFNNTNSPVLVGKTAHIKNDTNWAYSNHMTRIRFFENLTNSEFVSHYLQFLFYKGYFKIHCTNYVNQASIGKAFLEKDVLLPFPPLPEQHRIVQKIEELFTDLDAGVKELEKTKMQIKNYRQAVLKLALQGKLVPQDLADEPALKLIETIRTDITKDKIEGKKLVSINSEENLFELPDSWKWIRLGEILTFGPKNGYSPKPVKHVTNVRALTLTATTSGKFRDDCFKYIDEEIDTNSHLWLKENDILIQRGNTIEYVGIAAIYKGTSNVFIYPDLMMKIRIHPKISVDYLHMVINSKFSRKYFEKRATGTAGSMPKINQGTIVNLPIPLPPLAEQHRIVFEIDRRFSVIDQIEKTIDQSLIQAEKLRQSILKKAFEGELVSQNPNDESASVLLQKIKNTRAKLENSNKEKRKNTNKLRTKNIEEQRNSEKSGQHTKLYTILSLSEKSLTPKELWKLSGFDIEDFYAQLKIEIEKRRILEQRSTDFEVFLEIKK